jgi:DHA2 family multidrug resistance protein
LGLTFTGLLIFATSNSNPVRVTAFVAYIQVMRLDVSKLTAAARSSARQVHRAWRLARVVRREANVLSVIDGFTIALWAAIAGLLLISLMRPAPAGPPVPKSANSW